MDPLQNLSQLSPLSPVSGTSKSGLGSAAGGADGDLAFGDLLKQALQEVNQASAQAEDEARNLMTGESADMHTAMLAVQKADLSFQMMMAVRSKLIDAYREVMRMQM
ncbi:MAG: flagellar hook-basal body complex protein FliE [Geothrix sp.]|jgi:flagellar hook-basal body complex protein FliE|uniref:Flagellar hook-basal body complex protein FliE n=1 Tax=Candidatus Geothrix odensensis TaxID=2954440 RepID=A0A936F3A9_9BACT|nr:flagellar hook-basal body complex protein FliE [Candidatus Geothrix odensensis]MCC6513024.1 flagellar hook-basal body complex protein FliE [Geothrix sp.]